MSYSKYLKCLLLCCGCILSCLQGIAASGRLSLKRAMIAKIVSVNAVSLGGYLGNKNIKLNLTNNTDKDLTIDIDPGLVFRPEDTTYQDLVIIGQESLALAPKSNREITLRAFCGKSYAKGPRRDLCYNFLKQGDSNLVKTLKYVKENNTNVHLAQQAVWTYTNGHCLNTVYDHDHSRESEKFVQYLASLKRSTVPGYFIESQLDEREGQPALAVGKEKAYVDMHWGNEGYKHMYLTVYKADGTVYREIEADQVIDKYGYTVTVEFDPRIDPKGTYTVQLHDENHKIWDKKTVFIGMSPCDMQ